MESNHEWYPIHARGAERCGCDSQTTYDVVWALAAIVHATALAASHASSGLYLPPAEAARVR
eukprot:SAG11_NODE_35465_length_266_cov_0.928144_1_plen_61_part_01